jgi:glutathione peroxidase
MNNFYEFQLTELNGQPFDSARVQGKVVLIVNVASQCGFTKQYAGLEKLFRSYPERLMILGFPCNQFGAQESGSAEQIREFCTLNYEVSFPIMAKCEVNGPDAHPLYQWLKQQKTGLLGTEAIKWNFTKFLLDQRGNVIARYAPQTSPEELVSDIEQLLV